MFGSLPDIDMPSFLEHAGEPHVISLVGRKWSDYVPIPWLWLVICYSCTFEPIETQSCPFRQTVF